MTPGSPFGENWGVCPHAAPTYPHPSPTCCTVWVPCGILLSTGACGTVRTQIGGGPEGDHPAWSRRKDFLDSKHQVIEGGVPWEARGYIRYGGGHSGPL